MKCKYFYHLMLAPIFFAQAVMANPLQVHCEEANEIPTKFKYDFTRADFSFASDLHSTADAVYKFRSKASGKYLQFQGQVQFMISAENPDYLVTTLPLKSLNFSRVDFTLSKDPNDGGLGTLFPKAGANAVGGALFRCKLLP